MTREDILEKLEQIVQDEKFKLDAAFLCGAAAELPNQPLQRACEAYLAADKAGEPLEGPRAALTAQLEAALAKEPKFVIRGDLSDNRGDIRLVYENRDLL